MGNCLLSCSDVVIGHNFFSARIRFEADRASKRIRRVSTTLRQVLTEFSELFMGAGPAY